MKCTRCGLENSDQVQICQGCGAALQMTLQQPDVLRIGLDKRILGVIGFIAGVLALVGIFTSWATVSVWGMSASASAWHSVTRATVMGQQVEREAWACLSLAGAIIILIVALSVLASPRARILWGILVIGGLLAIAGPAWGFYDIPTAEIMGISVTYGIGVYLTLAGGILALSGVIGIRRT
jgi:hypothetical protein